MTDLTALLVAVAIDVKIPRRGELGPRSLTTKRWRPSPVIAMSEGAAGTLIAGSTLLVLKLTGINRSPRQSSRNYQGP